MASYYENFEIKVEGAKSRVHRLNMILEQKSPKARLNKAHYDLAELEEMNAEEVAEYNSLVGEEAVKVVSTVTDGSKVTLAMYYAGMEDYGDMNGMAVYNGTVSQAIAMGYQLGDAFSDAKTGESLTDINWDDLADKHVVIVNEPAFVYPFNKIVMVTDNVTVSEDRKVATVTGQEQAVIVFK